MTSIKANLNQLRLAKIRYGVLLNKLKVAIDRHDLDKADDYIEQMRVINTAMHTRITKLERQLGII